jgi:putative nucleotidyltransferase with HDIG domain
MESIAANGTGTTAQENVGKYFLEVMQKHQLPALPVVVMKVLEMLQDPDCDVRALCRILSDDAALAERVLAISRSAHYAQRTLPASLHAAVQVLGFRTLRNVLFAASTQKLLLGSGKFAEKLWSHSLATALAARLLCRHAGVRDADQAFLAGLLHDVGEMILVHGDSRGFEQMCLAVNDEKWSMVDKEKEMFGCDHTFIGRTPLDSWNIDGSICEAVLQHHEAEIGTEAKSLTAIIRMADYVCFQAELGFFAEPSAPAVGVMAAFGCGSPGSLEQLAQEVVQAYDEESSCFRRARKSDDSTWEEYQWKL